MKGEYAMQGRTLAYRPRVLRMDTLSDLYPARAAQRAAGGGEWEAKGGTIRKRASWAAGAALGRRPGSERAPMTHRRRSGS